MRSKFVAGGILVIVFFVGAALGAWQQTAQTRREPQFENDQVRVWKSTIMPNQPLTLHRHDNGRTIVALRGGTLEVVDASGRITKQMTWETGKAYWLDVDPPGQHGDINRGPDPVEVMVIEMRRPSSLAGLASGR